jgi:tetratricopeptide (TPR) repeat protein
VVDVLGIALRVAPLAHDAVRAVVDKNSLARLMKLVETDLLRSHRVPPGLRRSVANAWSRQRVDPEFAGFLTAWLATGNEELLVRAGKRWEQLLLHDEGLALADPVALAAIAMQSARRHLADAQPTDRDALHVEGEFTRNAVKMAAESLREHITRELAHDVQQSVKRASPKRRIRFNLPTVAAFFTGRDQELNTLTNALAVRDRVVITQAISGLGGIGKSQLAARYVQQYLERYDIVAWIAAEHGGIADLAQLAAKLNLPVDGLSPGDRALLALEWLGDCDNRWLLVLDNIETPEQLKRLAPPTGNGRVLVTSRDRAFLEFGAVLTLDIFDEETAIRYLTKRADRPDDVASARSLARALGYLPLALSHAGAYCQSGTSFSEYRTLLEGLPVTELFDTNPELSYTQTVASTWMTSIRGAAGVAPLAADVLELAAHLAPDSIPKSLFTVLIDGDTPRERKRLADALNALARLNLLTVDDYAVGVHRLLQKVVRDNATERHDQTAALRALAAVLDAFPARAELPAHWPLCERLLPHALALADTLPQPGDTGPELIDLLDRSCWYLNCAEPARRSLSVAHRVLGCAERVLGVVHPDTLRIRNNLAIAYQDAGRSTDALTLYESLLAHHREIFGAEHPDTLRVRNNCAIAYEYLGHVDQSIAIFERVLRDFERNFGLKHIDSLSIRNNLAIAYEHAGRSADAIAVHERLLADRTQILGHDHPHTLTTRHNLGIAYLSAGHIHQSIAVLESLAADRARILGGEHPDTLGTGNNLANAYIGAGRHNDAIALCEPLVADYTRMIGAEHPDTLSARNNLANAFMHIGWSTDAIAIYEALLPDYTRLLGAEHPDTVCIQNNLANANQYAARRTEASGIHVFPSIERTRIRGAAHSQTLTIGTDRDNG